MEIRKRYSQPLAIETGEFPDIESIQARMTPICYQESLPNGCVPQCAEIMAAATEQYIKEIVGSVLSRTRSNVVAGGVGGSTILTQKYKKQLSLESAAFDEGKLHRTPITNMLPVEAREASTRRALGLGDFKTALDIGGCSLGHMPDVTHSIVNAYPEGILEGWGRYPDNNTDITNSLQGKTLLNGAHAKSQANGVAASGNINGWAGSGDDDRNELFSALDDCLAIGRS